jgi:hypothetical protein
MLRGPPAGQLIHWLKTADPTKDTATPANLQREARRQPRLRLARSKPARPRTTPHALASEARHSMICHAPRTTALTPPCADARSGRPNAGEPRANPG